MDELISNPEILPPANGRILAELNASVKAAKHLKRSDDAAVELARAFARIIDQAIESGDPDRIHQVSCVAMPTLNKSLTSLGLNPEGRFKLKIGVDAPGAAASSKSGPPQTGGGPDELTALRAKRRAKSGGP